MCLCLLVRSPLTQSHAGWRSSTMSTSTTKKSTCRSRRSFLRERATATSSSSSQSSTSSSRWVLSHLLFTNASVSNVSSLPSERTFAQLQKQMNTSPCILSLPHQLSFVFAEFPMLFVLNGYLHGNDHILNNVKTCGKSHCASTHEWSQSKQGRTTVCQDSGYSVQWDIHLGNTCFLPMDGRIDTTRMSVC